VNKEEIVGMLVALERYLALDHSAEWKEWEARCATISSALSRFPDVNAEVHVPEIANAVPHLRITWDYQARNLTVPQVVEKLREGSPSIEVSPSSSRRQLGIGVWMMQPGDDPMRAPRGLTGASQLRRALSAACRAAHPTT
jgi:L-seryl-tRNA(Ser) seleniumtransferase